MTFTLWFVFKDGKRLAGPFWSKGGAKSHITHSLRSFGRWYEGAVVVEFEATEVRDGE